jgi:putative transposase
MGRWLAGRLMKELGLVSCQQPIHRYKRGGYEHIAIRITLSVSLQ